ncbi:AEC family transporter [Methanosphaera sp.]
MASPIEVILIPTVLIIIGYVLKRIGMLKTQDSSTLTKLVTNVSMPALIFVNLSTAQLNLSMIELPIATFIVSISCLVIAYLFCRTRHYSKVKTWTIMLAAAMINTGFIGYPITLGVYGNEGFLRAIFCDLATTMLFVIYGMVLVKEFGGDTRKVIIEGAKFMPFWAVVLGILFGMTNIQLGYVINNVLDYLGQATIPLIMISLGLTLDFRDMRKYLSTTLVVSFIRLVISPVLMFVILTLMGVKGLGFNVAILEAGMSTAMYSLVLSLTYDLDYKLMSSCIFTDIILSLGTLTIIISLLG